jgi:hypothetical protein
MEAAKKKRESISTDSPEWIILVERVVNEFEIGQLIPHEWLRQMFQINELNMSEYPDSKAFIMAVQQQQFEFLSIFESLRRDILRNHSFLLVNIRGQGYRIIHPKDQTQYAYDQLVKDVAKSFKEAGDIMSHVRGNLIDETQKSHDRALFSKMGTFKQLFQGFRK